MSKLKENDYICGQQKIGDIKRGKDRHAYIWLACIDCGKERWVTIRNGKPKSIRCKSCVRKGTTHPNFGKLGKDSTYWKGGKYKDGDGYIKVLIDSKNPYFIMGNHQGYVNEHRLIMAQNLDRPLTEDEVVHHKNEIRDDNRIENLELLKNDAEHLAYHRKLKQKNKAEKLYICGLCRHYDSDNCYCMATGKYEIYEEDTCDGWEDDNEVELTKEEKDDIVGDMKAHRRMVEGDEIV